MGEAKHTPGPWKAIKAAFRDEDQEEDRLIVSEEDHHVAEVFQYRQDKHHDADGTALANAALIAKAPLIPKLVVALRGVVDAEINGSTGTRIADYEKAAEECRIVLAEIEKP